MSFTVTRAKARFLTGIFYRIFMLYTITDIAWKVEKYFALP